MKSCTPRQVIHQPIGVSIDPVVVCPSDRIAHCTMSRCSVPLIYHSLFSVPLLLPFSHCSDGVFRIHQVNNSDKTTGLVICVFVYSAEGKDLVRDQSVWILRFLFIRSLSVYTNNILTEYHANYPYSSL